MFKFNQVTKQFSSTKALDKVNLTLNEGEILGFLGPNGAGKTTAIRVMTGFIKPTSGEVSFLGKDAWVHRREIAHHVGFVPDLINSYQANLGSDLLNYWSGLQGVTPILREELLDRLDFPRDALLKPVRTYSQGMAKKLSIIQALQHNPSVIILDEPTTSLDPLVQQTLFNILKEFKSKGSTIFMSSHNLNDVQRICDRVAMINNGAIIAEGNIADMIDQLERNIEIKFSTSKIPDLSSIEGITNINVDQKTVHLRVKGNIKHLLNVLKSQTVDDLVIERPNLDSVFLSYYQTEEK
ncbi:MAG: ABC transporter ATP-binding protein [Dehalococcoidia bacterium]